jgi:hypothetical protein
MLCFQSLQYFDFLEIGEKALGKNSKGHLCTLRAQAINKEFENLDIEVKIIEFVNIQNELIIHSNRLLFFKHTAI